MTDHPDSVSAAKLPWWQRPRKLRRQLAGTLVLVAFISVAIVGGLNFYGASGLLNDGTEEALGGIGEAQARSIEAGADRLLESVSAVAADLAVVEALAGLTEGYEALGSESLDSSQASELDAFYQQRVIEPLDAAGLGPVEIDRVAPGTDEGQYLQYHYTLTTDDAEDDPRRGVDDAGDGSVYSEKHREAHSYLAGLEAALGGSDLLLVSTDGKIVYSVEKQIDFGTDLTNGPYKDTALADALLQQLVRVRAGGSVVADYELYLPAGGRPTLFAAASVRRGTEIIGALVIQVPIEGLNTITAADGRWEEVGLRGGESYVVGSDRILRSESRRWIEDPDGYLEEVDDELADLIRVFGSPVGLQPVETEPVSEALGGDTFEGTSRNYLGEKTFSYATTIDVPGVEWIVVADVPLRDARSPLFDFAKLLGLVLLIILPAAAAAGVVLSSRLTRPIAPVVDAAAAIAAGERHPELPDLGRDEFGDLARRLSSMAEELGRHETALADERDRTRETLLTVLPPRLVDNDGELVGTGDAVDTATVVAVWIDLAERDSTDEDGLFDLLSKASRQAEEMVADRGMERIRGAADQSLFLAGIGRDDDGADNALGFTVDFAAALESLAARDEMTITVHMGLATGRVATGMLQRGNLTFAAWGEPVRRALAIGALGTSDEIVLDATTANRASAAQWELAPSGDHYDLDGAPVSLFTLAPRLEPAEGVEP